MKDTELRKCGYCHTGTHELCRPVIKWYDSTWYCYCECQQDKEKEETNGESNE